MKKWIGIAVSAVLLGMWLAGPVSAAGTCFGNLGADGGCIGIFVGVDTAGKGFTYIGDSVGRIYIWRASATAATGPSSYINSMLISHDTTVESGLSQSQIRNGDVTLVDSMGVLIGTGPGS
jgi:hypothetical protein